MIIDKEGQENSSAILVPDEKIQFDGDVSSLLGHVFIKNSNKIPVKFDEKLAKRIKHEDRNVKDAKSVALTYADLTKKEKGKVQGLQKWVVPKDEQDMLNPAGCYIASTTNENVYVKSQPRHGVNIKYVQPLIDAWSRQLKQPVIVNSARIMPDVNVLNKRGYQTNMTLKGNVCTFKFIDFLPYAFECYLKQNDTACLNVLNNFAENLFDKSDPMSYAVYQHQFIFAVLMFFEHLKSQLVNKKRHSLKNDLKDYDKIYQKATLMRLSEFIHKVLCKDLDRPEYMKTLNSYDIQTRQTPDKMTVFSLFVLLKQNSGRDDLLHHESTFLLTVSNAILLDLMLHQMSDELVDFCLIQATNTFGNVLIVNPTDFVVGKQITLKFKNRRNQLIAISTGSAQEVASIDENGFCAIMLDEFAFGDDLDDAFLGRMLTIKEHDSQSEITRLEFDNPDYKLPEDIQLVSSNINHDFKPLFLDLNPVTYHHYYAFIVNTLYQTYSDLPLSYKTRQAKRKMKCLFDLSFLDRLSIKLDQLPSQLTSGPSLGIQYTLIDQGTDLSQNLFGPQNLLEIALNNCNQIEIDTDHNFVAHGHHYEKYNQMPYWTLYKYYLNKPQEETKEFAGKNRMDRLIEKIIDDAESQPNKNE